MTRLYQWILAAATLGLAAASALPNAETCPTGTGGNLPSCSACPNGIGKCTESDPDQTCFCNVPCGGTLCTPSGSEKRSTCPSGSGGKPPSCTACPVGYSDCTVFGALETCKCDAPCEGTTCTLGNPGPEKKRSVCPASSDGIAPSCLLCPSGHECNIFGAKESCTCNSPCEGTACTNVI